LKIKSNVTLLLGILALFATTPGCSFISNLRAKDNLNNGVREFNKGKYEEAERRFAKALELDPGNSNAQLFHARALNQKFEQSQTEDVGLKTLKAYEDIISSSKDKPTATDQALAFMSGVYDKLAVINPEKAEEYKAKRRETVLKRAELPSATQQTKADVYYTLGHSYWDEAFQTSRPFTYADGSLRQPIPADVVQKLKPLVQKAHEYFQRAINEKQDYANAYFYEKLTYIQDAYLEPDPARKKDMVAKQREYQDKYVEIQKRSQEAPSGS
jgi:tetratricopeptide (TPR) repeat protein